MVTVEQNDLSLQRKLGLNISARRKSLGWTQEYLTQRMEVDTETISRFERGMTCPSLKSISKLASILSITIADLLGETTPPIPSQIEVVSKLLEPLNHEDRNYVTESLKSLCHFISGIQMKVSDCCTTCLSSII